MRMNRVVWMALLVCCLCFACALAEEAAVEPTESEWLYAEDENGATVDAPEADAEPDEIEDALNGAMEVYAWFALEPLDTDPEEPDESGARWLVIDERLDTMAKLEAVVRACFSDAIADELLSNGVYAETDGLLYASDEGRAPDDRIAETGYVVKERTEDAAKLEMKVYYLDGTVETYEYAMERVDGAWRFTEFPYFW